MDVAAVERYLALPFTNFSKKLATLCGNEAALVGQDFLDSGISDGSDFHRLYLTIDYGEIKTHLETVHKYPLFLKARKRTLEYRLKAP